MKKQSQLLQFVLAAAAMATPACGGEVPVDQLSSTSAPFTLPATRVKGYVGSDLLTGSFDANTFLSFNSTDPFEQRGHNHITQLATGSYRVDFPGLGAEFGGNVQVTHWDKDAGTRGRCKVERWAPSGTTLQAFVLCFNTAGNAINTRFFASYVRRNDLPGVQGGYVWANDPTAASYTPSATFQWNSNGSDVTIQRSGVGTYNVVFPGQSFAGGTVEVTAYGTGSNFCKVGSWSPNGSNQNVSVLCFSNGGSPADSMFSARFTRDSPNDTSGFGFAWADKSTIPVDTTQDTNPTYSKVMVPACSSSHPGGPVRETHVSTGRYGLDFTGLEATSNNLNHHPNVKVTAYGNTSDTCEIVGTPPNGGSTAEVQCFDTSGTPVNTRFTITYTDSYPATIIC
jgi:hypothetical protein